MNQQKVTNKNSTASRLAFCKNNIRKWIRKIWIENAAMTGFTFSLIFRALSFPNQTNCFKHQQTP
jgi:hypothetical protein